MSASLLALASAALVPLAQPAPERAGGQALLAACMGKEDFADPAPPARIYGNVWYVGTCTVSAILITSPKGHVLIDSGVEAAAPSVLANIARLGFRARDVKWLVAGHEHFDHTGALAALKAATGARVALSAPAAHVMATGKPDPADSQLLRVEGDGAGPDRPDRWRRIGHRARSDPPDRHADAGPYRRFDLMVMDLLRQWPVPPLHLSRQTLRAGRRQVPLCPPS